LLFLIDFVLQGACQRFALLECPCLGRGVSVSSAVIPTAGARTGRERCVWAGVDSAWEQEKLEARKMPENAAESHTSGARFVSHRFCLRDLLAFHRLACFTF